MSAPRAPRAFACLWCGRSWQPRDADDLEARARLCPDCLGRAGENPFLQFRLRRALEERASVAPAARSPAIAPAEASPAPAPAPQLPVTPPAAPSAAPAPAGSRATGAAPLPDLGAGRPDADDLDAWYLRRGRHAHGLVDDAAWQMELDAATTWLDGLPLGGEIVELAAGTGWWSALLATKGELHAYDASGALLDRARDRLLAHRLRAHLHERDPWTPPDRRVDAVVVAFGFGRAGTDRRDAFAALLAAWLRPGATLAVIEARDSAATGAVAGAVEPLDLDPGALAALLRDAGLVDVAARSSGRFLLLATAVAP